MGSLDTRNLKIKTNSFILVIHFEASWNVLRNSRFKNVLIYLVYFLCSAGPDTWHKDCPIASTGTRQSPIDLKASEAKHDLKLKRVVVSYPAFTDAKFLNNGHSVQFQPSAGHQSGNEIDT